MATAIMADKDQVRTAVRFPMRLTLRVKTSDGWIEAVTENISANGILITGQKLPAVKTEIEFTVKMPGGILGLKHDVVMHGNGRIVRHQQIGDQMQAAIIIDGYELRD
jgi:hypothetical protein